MSTSKPIRFDRFTGLYPRIPGHQLPETAATLARNCDFAYGELRSLKDAYLLKNLSQTAQSVFSEDGLRFYSWPADVDAVISPIGSGDANARLYYTSGADFRVTSRAGASTSGGVPGTSYRVGVPRPAVAPIVTISNTVSTSDLEGITPTATFHYESGGIKYQEQAITLTTLTAGKTYSFTAPARKISTVSGAARAARLKDPSYDPLSDELKDPTPANAIAVIHLIFKTALAGPTKNGDALGDVRLDQYSNNSKFAKDASIVVSLTQASTDILSYTVSLEPKYGADTTESRAYVYTYANIYNEEGAPSPPTALNLMPDSSVTIGCTIGSFNDYVPIKEIRVYRTQNGTTISDYFFAFAIPCVGVSGGVQTQKDDVKAALLNEVLSSWHNLPPKPSLQGLMNVGNGILAAWNGNELWFSDAYRPWSWPPSYVKSFSWPIVGAIVHGTGALVTTLGNPYLVSGISPDAMTEEKLNIEQAGVSKWSLCSVEGNLIYASNDGLVVLNGGRGSLAESEVFFTREVWRDKYQNGLTSMQFAEYDGALIVFSRANAFTPFLIRFDESQGAMSEIPDFVATSCFYLVTSDGLYYTNGAGLYQYAGGAKKELSWQSKEIITEQPNCYSIASALVDGNFTLDFFADGDKKWSQILTAGETTFRLPGGFLATHWQLKITGTGTFKRLRLANSGRQLAEL